MARQGDQVVDTGRHQTAPARSETGRAGAGRRAPGSGDDRHFTDDYLLYLLARASQLASGEFHAELERLGIAPQMWRVLALLSGCEGRTIGDIAKRALAKQPTMTKLIGRLEKLGYVSRTPGIKDRRQVVVTITPAGEELVSSLIERARMHEANLLDKYTPAETDALKRMLAQLIDKLDEPG